MLLLGALLLVAAAQAGSAQASPGRAAAAERRQCASLEVSSPREEPRRAKDRQPNRAAFSASRSLDLTFRTQLRVRRDEAHTLEFRVRAPRGFLYQSLAVPVSPAPAARPADGKHAVARSPRRTEVEVSATLPVAGTAITTNSLYGRWSVEPLLDGAPCAGARFFNLRP